MESNSLLDEIATDVEEVKKELPKSEKLKELSALIDQMNKRQSRIDALETALANETEEFQKLNSMLIPDLFDELGIKTIKLSDGRVVEVKLKYTGSITQENEVACFDWLKKNNHDGIIKHKVSVDIKKGETEEYEKLLEALTQLGISFADKNSVHPQTLYAFIREQIESGTNFPKDLFKVYPLRSTKVK